jgi:hypothetical protein
VGSILQAQVPLCEWGSPQSWNSSSWEAVPFHVRCRGNIVTHCSEIHFFPGNALS